MLPVTGSLIKVFPVKTGLSGYPSGDGLGARGRLVERLRALNPLSRLLRKPKQPSGPQKLYGAIVAQARLPVFYRKFGVPDTLEGRFAVLSLHLFAVLHRLKGEAAGNIGQAQDLAQELTDLFAADMDTVLREEGVGDIKVPGKMRKLIGATQARFASCEAAAKDGEAVFASAIAACLPLESDEAEDASARLAPYLMEAMRRLQHQSLASLLRGEAAFSPDGCEP